MTLIVADSHSNARDLARVRMGGSYIVLTNNVIDVLKNRTSKTTHYLILNQFQLTINCGEITTTSFEKVEIA